MENLFLFCHKIKTKNCQKIRVLSGLSNIFICYIYVSRGRARFSKREKHGKSSITMISLLLIIIRVAFGFAILRPVQMNVSKNFPLLNQLSERLAKRAIIIIFAKIFLYSTG